MIKERNVQISSEEVMEKLCECEERFYSKQGTRMQLPRVSSFPLWLLAFVTFNHLKQLVIIIIEVNWGFRLGQLSKDSKFDINDSIHRK